MAKKTTVGAGGFPWVSAQMLVEAKKAPKPERFVPVFDWDDKHIWLWVKGPGGKLLDVVALLHAEVGAYKDKLGWSSKSASMVGQMDPAVYKGPKDIYPLDWKAGTPLPKGPPEKKVQEKKYVPPVQKAKKKKAAKKGLPAEFEVTGKKDPNGYELVKDSGSGAEYSVLPNGKFAEWVGVEGVYYAIEKQDGEWDVHTDSPVYTPEELAVKPEKAAPKKAAKPKKAAPKKAAKPKKAAQPKKAAKPKELEPVEVPLPVEPAQEPVLSDKPESAPDLTKYAGKVDGNGFPLVDEYEAGDEHNIVAQGLTLLPDERVSRWRPDLGGYLIYDYHPHHGFMYSKSKEVVTVDEAESLLQMLSLVVKNGRYHQVKSVGAEPTPEADYPAAMPPNCKPLGTKDPNGLPLVGAEPDDPDFGAAKVLSLLPNGRVGEWEPDVNKYLLWEWRSVLGYGSYYPTHPAERVTLKEVKKMLGQVPAPAKTPPAKPKVKPAVKKVELATGTLKPTNKNDDQGYPFGVYRKKIFSMLPDQKVGVWSKENGGYILYKFDADTASYYNTGSVWTPPGKHKSLANAYLDNQPLAQVGDHKGTEVVVLPNGKFAKMTYATGVQTFEVHKVNPGDKTFEPTGEVLTPSQVKTLQQMSGDLNKLRPVGEVDVNGLPFYSPPSGHSQDHLRIALLPDGRLAKYSPSKKKYLIFGWTAETEWFPLEPYEWVTLDDLEALYLKAGAESAAPPKTDPGPAIQGDQVTPSHFAYAGKDDNGFPVYEVEDGPDAGEEVSKLPNGYWGVWGPKSKTYEAVAALTPDGGLKFFTTKKYFTLTDLETPVAEPTGAVTPDSTLLDMGEEDAVGLPLFRISGASPDGAALSRVPDEFSYPHKYMKYGPSKKQYRVLEFDAVEKKWKVKKGVNITPGGPYLLPTGEKDSNGYLTYRTWKEPFEDEVHSKLPDGRVALWFEDEQRYVVLMYDSGAKKWNSTAQQLSPAQIDSGEHTVKPTGGIDQYGLPEYEVVKGDMAGKKLTKLPDGRYAVITPDGLYTLLNYEPKNMSWASGYPSEKVDPETVMGAEQKGGGFTLAAMGEKDSLGLEKFQVVMGGSKGLKMSQLPDGRYVSDLADMGYAVMEYHPAKQTWDFAKPDEIFSAVQIKAMLGQEPEPEKGPKKSPAEATLEALKKDENGFPRFRVIVGPSKGLRVSKLPDGRYGWLSVKGKNYSILKFDPPSQKWAETGEKVSVGQAMMLKVQAQEPKPTPEDPSIFPGWDQLIDMEVSDPNGYPKYQVQEGPEEKLELSRLPKGLWGWWASNTKQYVILYFDGEYWVETDPWKVLTLDQVKGMEEPASTAEPGMYKLSPEGKDPHGFPWYRITSGPEKGTRISKLPSGQWAWLSPSGAYTQYQFEGGEWVEVESDQGLLPSQAKAGELFEPVPGQSEEEGIISGGGLWKPTGEKDANGFPLFKLIGGEYAGLTLTRVAFNTFGMWLAPAGEYQVWSTDKEGAWKPTPVTLAVDAVQVIHDGEKILQVMPGKTDEYGLKQYKVIKGKNAGEVLSQIPMLGYAVYSDVSERYYLMKYNPKKVEWEMQADATGVPSSIDLQLVKDLVKSAKESHAKAMAKAKPKRKTPEELGLQETGMKDKHGLPVYEMMKGKWEGVQVSKLPDGRFAKINLDWKVYTPWAVDQETGELEPTTDNIGFDEIEGLTVPEEPEAKPGEELLSPTTKKDPLGLPIYDVVGGADTGWHFSKLPDGSYAKHSTHSNGYVPVTYNTDSTEWDLSTKTIPFDSVKAMIAGEAVPAVATAVDDYLNSYPTPDVNGLQRFVVMKGPAKGNFVSKLPDGRYGRWSIMDEVYVIHEFGPVAGWSVTDEKVTLSQLSGMASKGQATAVSEPQSEPPKPPKPAPGKPAPPMVTPDGTMPNPDEMEDIGAEGMKGAGKKTVLRDPKTGKRYLFKPSIPKGGPKKTEAFRAKSQEAFASIAAIGRPDAHVPVETVKHKGQLGTLQPMLELDPEQSDLAMTSPDQLTEQQKADVASEHLMDWLMSQHDSFGANFVITKEGRVVGIDKEQGWKYVDHPTHPDRLATDYKPNTALYGEQEPYYNKFWRAFADGKMDFDPQQMTDTLKRLEKMDAKHLERAVEGYLATRKDMMGAQKAYERYAFTKKMLSRRATLRRDFEKFITEQYQERTGKGGEFTFKQGWEVAGEEEAAQWEELTMTAREWALKTLGSKAIKPHKDYPELALVRVEKLESITTVEKFLSDMGVPATEVAPDGTKIEMNPIMGSVYNSIIVEKKDLEKIITKTIEIKKEPGQKYTDHAGLPTYHATVLPPEESPPNVEGLATAHKLKLGPLGKDFTLDSDAVEQQTANVQRVVDPDGKTFYIVHFKLREPYWRPLLDEGKSGKYAWPMGAYDSTKDALVMSSSQGSAYHEPARIFEFPGGDELAVLAAKGSYGDVKTHWAFRGTVNATIRSGESGIKTKLKKMLAHVGLDKKVLKNPTPEEVEVAHLVQALWHMAPKKHENLSPEDYTPAKLRQQLKGVLTKDQIQAIRQVEGTVGRGAPMIPGLWKTLGGGTPDDPVVRFVFWGVKLRSVDKILKSAATGIHERARMGLGAGDVMGPGTTEDADISTGGADNTTMRIATKRSAAAGTGLQVGNVGGIPAKLIISPEVLDRLDIHLSVHTSGYDGMNGDSFGCTNPGHTMHGKKFRARQGMSKDVERFDNPEKFGKTEKYSANTELVIRRGVSPNLIKRVCVSSEYERKEVLKHCEDAGITEHNGCPIEDFVVVETSQQGAYDKYLKPLGL